MNKLSLHRHNPLLEWPFDEFFGMPSLLQSSWSDVRGLNADVYETQDNVVVKIAIPGIKPEDINIQIAGDTLTVSGEVNHQSEDQQAQYLQKQLYNGRFTQMLTLPTSIQSERAEADFDNGIVTLTLPKSEEIKPRTIQVKSGQKSQQKLLK